MFGFSSLTNRVQKVEAELDACRECIARLLVLLESMELRYEEDHGPISLVNLAEVAKPSDKNKIN